MCKKGFLHQEGKMMIDNHQQTSGISQAEKGSETKEGKKANA